MAVRSLVLDVGNRLGRKAADVEPYVEALKENWYDSMESLGQASADDLTNCGLPRRFAVELAAAAEGGGGKGRKGKKGKGKGKEFRDGEKGGGKSSSKGGGKGERQQILPIDLDGVDAVAFKFRRKIIGKGGSNVHHIQDQSGAALDVRGSDEEGLEILITAHSGKSVKIASELCEDLIGALFQEYDDENGGGGKKKGGGKAKGKGKGKDKGKDEGKGKKGKGKKGKRSENEEGTQAPEDDADMVTEEIPVDIEGLDPELNIRRELVGEGGRNVKHIEQESGVQVKIQRGTEEGQGPTIVLRSKDGDAINVARQMCEDLLASVLADIADGGVDKDKQKESSKGERKGSGKKNGKGKGKGKGKSRDEGKGKGKKRNRNRNREEGDDAEEDRPAKAAKTDE